MEGNHVTKMAKTEFIVCLIYVDSENSGAGREMYRCNVERRIRRDHRPLSVLLSSRRNVRSREGCYYRDPPIHFSPPTLFWRLATNDFGLRCTDSVPQLLH